MKELVEYIAKSLVDDPSQVEGDRSRCAVHRRSWNCKSRPKIWAG